MIDTGFMPVVEGITVQMTLLEVLEEKQSVLGYIKSNDIWCVYYVTKVLCNQSKTTIIFYFKFRYFNKFQYISYVIYNVYVES